MKRLHFLISTLFLVTTPFLQNGFAQDYVHYATLTGHTRNITNLAFSPDGQTLASASGDGTIRFWDVATGQHRNTLDMGYFDIEGDFAFSPDGNMFAVGSVIKISLWDVATGQLQKTLAGHTTMITSVAFSPDGQTLASGSWGGILLWDVATGQLQKTLTEHTHDVLSVAFSPDGVLFASGSRDKTIRLWNAVTGESLKILTGHTDRVTDVVFSSDANTLASVSEDKIVRFWDVVTGQHRKTLTGFEYEIHDSVFSLDGSTLATGSIDGIRLWDVATGKLLKIFTSHTMGLGIVFSFAFSPDWTKLAVGGLQQMVPGGLQQTIQLCELSSSRLRKNPFTAAPVTVKTDSTASPKLSANQVYNNAIRSVMWTVNPGIGEGSGVLFDKRFRLAITNAHVTGRHNTIDVYFPEPDENGELIKDRNFYLTSKSVLKRLGYYTKGQVVARNEKTDLAIIRLDGLPETAREIDWDFTTPTTNAGDLVYILGNPGGQDLWRWTLGEYLKDHGDFLHIQSDVFGGNSGGPVLNKQGILIGIVARSDKHMNALVIPVRDINRLLSESGLEHSRSRR